MSPSYVDSLPGYEGPRAPYLDVGPKDAEESPPCSNCDEAAVFRHPPEAGTSRNTPKAIFSALTRSLSRFG